MAASTFYSEGILPCRPAAAPSSVAIKNSTHKKLKPFLKAVEKEGLIKLKEKNGDIQVTSVDMNHPDIISHRKYRTVGEEERKEAKAASTIAETLANVKPMVITELYKPLGSTIDVFSASQARYV